MPIPSLTKWDPQIIVTPPPPDGTAQLPTEPTFTDHRTAKTYDHNTLQQTLLKNVSRRPMTLSHAALSQVKADIGENILFPRGRSTNPASELTSALLRASGSVSQAPTELQRRMAAVRMAHDLGIIEPPCDGQNPAEMSIVMLDTQDQVNSRDEWLGRQDLGQSTAPSLADQHAESQLLSAMCRSIDPDKVRLIDQHLINLSLQRAATPRRTVDDGIIRGEIWPDQNF